MFAGISGAMTLIACGLVLVAAGRAACDERGIRVRTPLGRLRVVLALLILAAVAAFCGYQLEVFHDTCRRGLLIPHMRGVAVKGEQFDQLFALHAVLILGLTFAAFAVARRCIVAHRPIDRLIGITGLVTMTSAGAALAWTYPASIYDRNVYPYAFLVYLVGLPATLLLLVASLFLLGRRKASDADTDLEYPLCLACGYNLTGNTSGCCPECGSSIPDATRRRLTTRCVPAADQPHWPRGIVLACNGFATLWICLTIVRHVEALNRLIYGLAPSQTTWAIVVHAYYPFLLPTARIGLDLAITVVLLIGAYGLAKHRRWGVWVCYVWLTVTIPLVIREAVRLGAGMVYGVSPGAHSDVIGLWFAFLRGAIGAGFPIFLALWLSQRHVRHRTASWGR